jgi:hypothetical protein
MPSRSATRRASAFPEGLVSPAATGGERPREVPAAPSALARYPCTLTTPRYSTKAPEGEPQLTTPSHSGMTKAQSQTRAPQSAWGSGRSGRMCAMNS